MQLSKKFYIYIVWGKDYYNLQTGCNFAYLRKRKNLMFVEAQLSSDCWFPGCPSFLVIPHDRTALRKSKDSSSATKLTMIQVKPVVR